MLVDTVSKRLLRLVALNENNGLWLLGLLQKLLFTAVQGLFMNSAFTMFLLMFFEVPFGFNVHDVETAECDPEDDFKSEDAYQ